VQEFIHEQILPSFLDSACWAKISHAEQVHIEKPLPGRVRVDQIEFEFDGNGDLVLRNPDGTWEIIDLKITLTDLTANAKRRYALQVATYRYLLQKYVEEAVETSIEVFGVHRDTIRANQASSTQGDETWLKNLLHGSILERDAMTISIDETG
jgi:predicted RecB family nuclease